MDVGVFGENRRRNLDDYSMNNVVYNDGSIVKYMYSIARKVAGCLRLVDTKICSSIIIIIIIIILLLLPIFYGFRQQGELSLIEGFPESKLHQ